MYSYRYNSSSTIVSGVWLRASHSAAIYQTFSIVARSGELAGKKTPFPSYPEVHRPLKTYLSMMQSQGRISPHRTTGTQNGPQNGSGSPSQYGGYDPRLVTEWIRTGLSRSLEIKITRDTRSRCQIRTCAKLLVTFAHVCQVTALVYWSGSRTHDRHVVSSSLAPLKTRRTEAALVWKLGEGGFKTTREGRKIVEDDKHSGRPQTSLIAYNIKKVLAVVRKNRLQAIAESVGISSAICRILTKDFNVYRVYQYIVPRVEDISADEVKSAFKAALKDMAEKGLQKCFDDRYNLWLNCVFTKRCYFEVECV
ncbi:hypothetical protein TNCV_2000231 [Trichonephila clavipes]|nr:hypothetical protein TNCV_2000231 [Trichonephila clavipes]